MSATFRKGLEEPTRREVGGGWQSLAQLRGSHGAKRTEPATGAPETLRVWWYGDPADAPGAVWRRVGGTDYAPEVAA